ncbi:hypothetical protein Hdeb2414_s0003g00107171 [Helianthus debilis subsp. tardiflorus]
MFGFQRLMWRHDIGSKIVTRLDRRLFQIKLGSLETQLKSRLSDLYCSREYEICGSICLLVWDNERIKYCPEIVVMDSPEQSDSPSAAPR